MNLSRKVQSKNPQNDLRGQAAQSAAEMRKDKTKAEFEEWTRDAERKRDTALEPYARAESEEERQRIVQEVAVALNSV